MQWLIYSSNVYKQYNESQTLKYKHHLWQLIQYWWPTNLQGAYIQVCETCQLRYGDNSYYWYVIVTNIKIVVTDNDISCVTVTNIKIILWDNIYWKTFWLGPVDLVLFTLHLELLDLNLHVKKGHIEIWGKPLVLYCTNLKWMVTWNSLFQILGDTLQKAA